MIDKSQLLKAATGAKLPIIGQNRKPEPGETFDARVNIEQPDGSIASFYGSHIVSLSPEVLKALTMTLVQNLGPALIPAIAEAVYQRIKAGEQELVNTVHNAVVDNRQTRRAADRMHLPDATPEEVTA